MIDIDLTYRDKYGKITYGFKKNSTNTGIEILLQKVTTLLLSETKTTYFGTIVGGNISKVGMYNFNSDDFKVNLTDAILNIKKKIQQDEVNNNINHNDRLKSLSVKEVLYDKKTMNVVISLSLSTNSSSTLASLTVK